VAGQWIADTSCVRAISYCCFAAEQHPLLQENQVGSLAVNATSVDALPNMACALRLCSAPVPSKVYGFPNGYGVQGWKSASDMNGCP